MGVLDRLRRWLGRADDAAAGVERAAMEGLHKAEDAVDHATGGRLYDTLEKADEEAEELVERPHGDEHEHGHEHEPGHEHEAPSEEPRQQP